MDPGPIVSLAEPLRNGFGHDTISMMSENPGYRFPGMDPWLETPARWQSLHDRLIIYVADEIAAQLAPRYSARPGERLVIEQLERHIVPDVVVTETRRPAPSCGSRNALTETRGILFGPINANERQ